MADYQINVMLLITVMFPEPSPYAGRFTYVDSFIPQNDSVVFDLLQDFLFSGKIQHSTNEKSELFSLRKKDAWLHL